MRLKGSQNVLYLSLKCSKSRRFLGLNPSLAPRNKNTRPVSPPNKILEPPPPLITKCSHIVTMMHRGSSAVQKWLRLLLRSSAWANFCISFHLCCYCHSTSTSVMKSKFQCKLHTVHASALRLRSQLRSRTRAWDSFCIPCGLICGSCKLLRPRSKTCVGL